MNNIQSIIDKLSDHIKDATKGYVFDIINKDMNNNYNVFEKNVDKDSRFKQDKWRQYDILNKYCDELDIFQSSNKKDTNGEYEQDALSSIQTGLVPYFWKRVYKSIDDLKKCIDDQITLFSVYEEILLKQENYVISIFLEKILKEISKTRLFDFDKSDVRIFVASLPVILKLKKDGFFLKNLDKQDQILITHPTIYYKDADQIILSYRDQDDMYLSNLDFEKYTKCTSLNNKGLTVDFYINTFNLSKLKIYEKPTFCMSIVTEDVSAILKQYQVIKGSPINGNGRSYAGSTFPGKDFVNVNPMKTDKINSITYTVKP